MVRGDMAVPCPYQLIDYQIRDPYSPVPSLFLI